MSYRVVDYSKLATNLFWKKLQKLAIPSYNFGLTFRLGRGMRGGKGMEWKKNKKKLRIFSHFPCLKVQIEENGNEWKDYSLVWEFK